jgi:hypothetical protein
LLILCCYTQIEMPPYMLFVFHFLFAIIIPPTIIRESAAIIAILVKLQFLRRSQTVETAGHAKRA